MLSFNQLTGQWVSDNNGNTTVGTSSSASTNPRLPSGTTGALNNTAVGYGALQFNTEGQHNIAIGVNALRRTSGDNNLAIGENALYDFAAQPNVVMAGNNNVAIGNNVMQRNSLGTQNVAMGHQALNNNATGFMNVAIGNNALQGSGATGTGSQNVAIGNQALNNNTAGIQNVVVGMVPDTTTLLGQTTRCWDTMPCRVTRPGPTMCPSATAH